MTEYYLAPESWSSDSYRDVYSDDDIDELPDDWCVDAIDCDYIGDFDTIDEAIVAARENDKWKDDMRPE